MNTTYIIATLGIATIDDIEYVYKKRLSMFYIINSRTEIERPTEGWEYDHEGNITNVMFEKIYSTGVEIPETDFITEQIELIGKAERTDKARLDGNVKRKGLSNEKRALLKAYKRFLKNRMNFLKGQDNTSRKGDASKENRTFTFNNNFDHVGTEKVYNHFYEGLVEKKYFKEKVLKEFLKSAFENRERPQQKITLGQPNIKGKVRKVFYNYYNIIAGKPHGKQPEYICLLSDFFEGFNYKSLKSNFNK